MAVVIEVLANWATVEEELVIAGVLERFCLSPHNPEWLGLEEAYPSAKRAWEIAVQSLAKLIAVTYPFVLSVSSMSLLKGDHEVTKPDYVPTLSLGYIDHGLGIGHRNPILVKATSDLAQLLKALGATWCMEITMD